MTGFDLAKTCRALIDLSRMNQALPNILIKKADEWQQHEFFKDSVVLGVDVGLEGIGIHIRAGEEIVYAKTLQYNVPEAARLETRRQLRSARHCRTNRKTRLSRLKSLFEKHHLPWLPESSAAVLNSDPYILRHRAVVSENGLASKEALSLAIRHCVAHRGYDYEYFNDEGAYPWGDSTVFKMVVKDLKLLWITEEDARNARNDALQFDWSDVELEEFNDLLKERTKGPEIIEQRLAAHAKGEHNHLRVKARGEPFPRKFVWQHLEQIIRRHSHLITDTEEFLLALAVDPKKGAPKKDAIFYFHRKTPAEMRAHFEKKRARCAYAAWLGLGDLPIDTSGHQTIRRFRLLEFATTRDLELTDQSRVPIGEKMTSMLLEWIEKNPDARTQREISPVVQALTDHLSEIHTFVPPDKTRPKRAVIKRTSEHNKWFFLILRDLLAPSVANRRKNSPMCAAAAERLYSIATVNGLSREAVNKCLKNCQPGEKTSSLYDFRRLPSLDLYGVYPQVEFLLGQRVKKQTTRHGKKRGDLAHPGKLQQLFSHLSERLGGRTVPDYCVVETARDLPRTLQQKTEIEKEQKARRDDRNKLFAKYGITDTGKRSARTRIKLYAQQNGLCPFSGESLGENPLSDLLDIEHLFPASRGGITMDDNLVLTFARINRSEKKDLTPREYAATSAIPFQQMLNHTLGMRWGAFKREVFAWDKSDEIPPFGNVTRTAQLARQLRAEIAHWMGVDGDADRTAQFIGTPTGFQTAACRRAWGLPMKDRADLTHHLVDAAILAHIPPREGQNIVQYGGIFYSSHDPVKRRTILNALPLGPDPAMIARLAADDAMECPVEKHRPASNRRSQHDKTLFRVLPDGSLVYRKEIPAKETLDPEGIRANLLAMHIPNQLIPSASALGKWLDTPGSAPLRLLNGTPVTVFWVGSGKGSLKDDPTGFAAKWNEKGELQGIKSVISGRWAALELWRGWNTKKQCWQYYKQLVPAPGVLKALRSLGYNWDKKCNRPWRKDAPNLDVPIKSLFVDPLPPFARRAIYPGKGEPVVFRLGKTYLAAFNSENKLAKPTQSIASHRWIRVQAVNAESHGRIEFILVLSDDDCGAPMNVNDLAAIAGLPPADDSSSYPTQRPSRPSRPDGEADFRLE